MTPTGAGDDADGAYYCPEIREVDVKARWSLGITDEERTELDGTFPTTHEIRIGAQPVLPVSAPSDQMISLSNQQIDDARKLLDEAFYLLKRHPKTVAFVVGMVSCPYDVANYAPGQSGRLYQRVLRLLRGNLWGGGGSGNVIIQVTPGVYNGSGHGERECFQSYPWHGIHPGAWELYYQASWRCEEQRDRMRKGLPTLALDQGLGWVGPVGQTVAGVPQYVITLCQNAEFFRAVLRMLPKKTDDDYVGRWTCAVIQLSGTLLHELIHAAGHAHDWSTETTLDLGPFEAAKWENDCFRNIAQRAQCGWIHLMSKYYWSSHDASPCSWALDKDLAKECICSPDPHTSMNTISDWVRDTSCDALRDPTMY